MKYQLLLWSLLDFVMKFPALLKGLVNYFSYVEYLVTITNIHIENYYYFIQTHICSYLN